MRVSQIVFRLQKNGNRITTTRKKIIEIFSKEVKPINARLLFSKLSVENKKINKTTIYREIEFLLKQGLIKEIYIDSKETFYESTDMTHHHHFVCNNCGRIQDIVLKKELRDTEKELEKRMKFKVKKPLIGIFRIVSGLSVIWETLVVYYYIQQSVA